MSEIRLTGQLICRDDSEIVWEVSEHFRDAEPFALHQERVRTSEWGRRTSEIKRSYAVTGLQPP